MKKIILVLLAGSFLGACSSSKAPNDSMNGYNSSGVNNSDVDSSANKEYLSNNSVYFDFNKYNLKPEFADVITKNADYLTSMGSAKIQIQGNADDIGSVEYDISLGQKRADAVKQALVASGVSADQIEVVSNGKLKPVFDNHNDDGRAHNRRADIFYKADAPSGYSINDKNLPDFYAQ